MFGFQGSTFLNELINSKLTEGQNTKETHFKPNPSYKRNKSLHVHHVSQEQQQQQQRQHDSLKDLNQLLQLNKQFSQHSHDQISQKKVKQSVQEKYDLNQNVGDTNTLAEQKLQQTQEEAWYDEQAYERMIKPDYIEMQNEIEKEQSLLEALQRNEFVLFQFPNIIPFEQIETQQKKQQKNINLDNPIELLQEYYSELYDSSGYGIKKNYKKMLDQGQGDKQIGIKLGKIVIDRNGNGKWITGKQKFDIQNGIKPDCLNKCMSVNMDKKEYSEICEIENRFIMKPNVDNLISQL